MNPWVWLMGAVLSSVAANLLIKQAGHQAAAGLLTLPFLLRFASGAAVFAIGLGFYQKALVILPLTLAYPVMVGCIMALATLLATTVFGERFTLGTALGMILVLSGVAVLSMQRD